MSTLLGRRFPPTTGIYPPHMSPEDFKLFKRWGIDALKDAINVYYDIGLGEGAPADIVIEDNLRLMWQKITQKRADVVVEYLDHVDIVELRFNATSNAIGRLLAYQMLWNDEPPIAKETFIVLVSNRFDPDLERLAGQHNIRYLIV